MAVKKAWLFCALICMVFLKVSGQSASSTAAPVIFFEAHPNQQFGFDAFAFKEWSTEYETWEKASQKPYKIPFKSVGFGQTDLVNARLLNGDTLTMDSLSFRIYETGQLLSFVKTEQGLLTLELPPMGMNYLVSAIYRGREIGQLKVIPYKLRMEKVYLVPLAASKVNIDSLEAKVNRIYRQANVQVDLEVLPVFQHPEWEAATLLDNPSVIHERYSNQMHDLRDLYVETHPDMDKKAYYLFLVPGFTDPGTRGYMVRNKALGFVKVDKSPKLAQTIARQLGYGMGFFKDSWMDDGPAKGSTHNLMDIPSGREMRHKQWGQLRFSAHSYSLFDNYEDVRTNNGFVAYYFWKEKKNGELDLGNGNFLAAIKHPYKKNYLSYHLNIDNVLFQPLFTWGGKFINTLHLFVSTAVLLLGIYFGRKVGRWIKNKYRRPRLRRFIWRLIQLGAIPYAIYLMILFVNLGYSWFEVRSGKLDEMNGLSVNRAISYIAVNDNVKHPSEMDLSSELVIQRGKTWRKEERMPVLYFAVRQDKKGEWTKVRLQAHSDSLVLSTRHYAEKAESHYLVFNYITPKGGFQQQRVFNYAGNEITDKLDIPDPAKRILLFVNGYRPTSIGHTFEENFADIKQKGLEFPDSRNLVYTFDRYEYWRPWNAIDQKFEKRINPSETYYADGHFSVSTSNHRSLINFTTVSAAYPKRCSHNKKHHCYTSKSAKNFLGSRTVRTINMHRTRPNKSGFRKRLKNGHIAGRNIYQMLNEVPNRSENDTLYIVAHSMGYAYALGIIEELRGKIQFGSFYIIAPENASAGTVHLSEWQDVWQYGSRFQKGSGDAPCLLDGVAPQVKANGLKHSNRIYIPEKLYKKKGFFDSHFIGYYTWILDIEKGRKGYIKAH